MPQWDAKVAAFTGEVNAPAWTIARWRAARVFRRLAIGGGALRKGPAKSSVRPVSKARAATRGAMAITATAGKATGLPPGRRALQERPPRTSGGLIP